MHGCVLHPIRISCPLRFTVPSAVDTSPTLRQFLACSRMCMASLHQIQPHSYSDYLADDLGLTWDLVDLWRFARGGMRLQDQQARLLRTPRASVPIPVLNKI